MTATNTISNIQGTTAWGLSAIQSHWTVTAKLARFIGHLEARKGVAPVL